MKTKIAAAGSTEPWLKTFWRGLKRVEKSKLNGTGLALRNSLAVALPLGIGIWLGYPLVAVAVTTGALNVAYSDGRDPYAHRARRMLMWSVLGAFAVFLGSVTGNYHLLAIVVASAWALVAGLLVSISSRAADLGLNTLVALIVFAARGALSPKGAFYASLLVLAGGLLQTGFALLSWPLRRYGPERLAIGKVYLDLANQVDVSSGDLLAAPMTLRSAEVQDTLSALGRDHSGEGERFRLLFDQADRLRFSLYAVCRVRAGLEQENTGGASVDNLKSSLDRLLRLSQKLLHLVGHSLLTDDAPEIPSALLEQLRQLVRSAQPGKDQPGSKYGVDSGAAADVLAGQVRLVVQLANSATAEGAEEFARREFAPPWNLQMRGWLATLRANLGFESAAFRHGVRLAACVAIGDAIGRSVNTQRNYWLPMTVAVVLKPDFTTTISRGVLRLCGTFAGLLLATALYELLPQSALTQLALVGVFTFFMRYVGPANYGLFSILISGLIVFLIATTGIPPLEVVGERAINTAMGGIFALLAYALWPTWERSQVTEVLADMIDRTRDYFRAVVRRLEEESEAVDAVLEQTRSAWRQARSNAEASVDRVAAEPGVANAQLDTLTSMLSSSHAFMRVTMGLEAGIVQGATRITPPAFEGFSHDVEFTLYFLASALRGSAAAAQTLPQLREDHRRLVEAYERSSIADDFVLTETDRLTVSLNTLREQVIRYVSSNGTVPAQTVHRTMV